MQREVLVVPARRPVAEADAVEDEGDRPGSELGPPAIVERLGRSTPRLVRSDHPTAARRRRPPAPRARCCRSPSGPARPAPPAARAPRAPSGRRPRRRPRRSRPSARDRTRPTPHAAPGRFPWMSASTAIRIARHTLPGGPSRTRKSLGRGSVSDVPSEGSTRRLAREVKISVGAGRALPAGSAGGREGPGHRGGSPGWGAARDGSPGHATPEEPTCHAQLMSHQKMVESRFPAGPVSGSHCNGRARRR